MITMGPHASPPRAAYRGSMTSLESSHSGFSHVELVVLTNHLIFCRTLLL